MDTKLPQELEDQFTQLNTFYYEDRLLQCSRILADLDSKLRLSDPSEDASIQEELQRRLKSQFVQQVLAECAQVGALKKMLNEEENWTLSYDGTDTKVWYRREKDTATHTVRINGTIRAPLVNVAALLYESDLYQRLFWYVTSSKLLAVNHASAMKRAAHIHSYVPWPLHDRDVTLFAFAVDALQDDDNESGGTIIVSSRSVCETDPVSDVPPPAPRVIRADFNTSGFELRPVSPTETHARFLYNCDPKIAFVPMTLVNWAARTLCRWSLRVLEARARQLSGVSPEYEERIATAPVYDTIRARLKSFWDSKGVPSDAVDNPPVVPERTSVDFDADARPDAPPSIMKSLIVGDTNGAASNEESNGLRKRLTSKLFGNSSSTTKD